MKIQPLICNFFGFREKLCIIVQIVAQVQHIYNFLFIRPSNA